ncbi:hypothetical protein M422DRAFT_33526 [Sphaerobolus stellatus SS14]|uniref:Uncharacterized protein n=1 Tax=Sphaerobolus stellatus (strain SS14) TaxID=990650 RepID=A0A0C9V8T5_SPHS4|nr:hypothetical protein M422DRAFT_33526 [Sphaerobolus stellatus SS14]
MPDYIDREYARPRSPRRERSPDRSRARERGPSKDRYRHDSKERHPGKKSSAVTFQWGKYGVINETDQYNKEEEFRAWLVEECKISPEIMSKEQTKKQSSKFVEDYNTVALPHEKFYDMKRYDARMSLLRHGEFVADLRAHSSAHKRVVVEQDSHISKATEQLKDLRRVQRERVEIAKRKQLGLEVSRKLGVWMEEFDD